VGHEVGKKKGRKGTNFGWPGSLLEGLSYRKHNFLIKVVYFLHAVSATFRAAQCAPADSELSASRAAV
jgi:hypothetical protein